MPALLHVHSARHVHSQDRQHVGPRLLPEARLRVCTGQGRCQGEQHNDRGNSSTAAPSKAQFDKLVAYVQELVKDHNALEERVIELERREEARRNHENQQPGVGRNKTNPKFQGRDALEAEAS